MIRSPRGRTALHVLGALALVALVVPFVVYSVPGVIGADASYVVLTGSMEPSISPGDAIVVRSVPPERIATGDVITFRRAAGDAVPVTHRVLEVTTDADGRTAFVTKGDANEDPDSGLVTGRLVVGEVLVVLPYVGLVVQFVDSPAGFALAVVVPISLLVLNEVYGLVASSRTGRDGDDSDPPDPGAGASTAATDGVGTGADAGDEIVLTRADLTASAIAVAALAVYAAYTGWTSRDALSVAVAVGAIAALLLVVGVRQYGTPPAESGPASSDAAAVAAVEGEPSVPTAALDGWLADRPRVRVDTVAGLVALGARTGHPVVRDGPDGPYLLVDGVVVYEAVAPPAATDADEASTATIAVPETDADAGTAESDPATTDAGPDAEVEA
jgi:signal peptidase